MISWIILFFLFLLIVLGGFAAWRYLSTQPDASTQPCKAGQCAVNIFTGEKKCPNEKSGVVRRDITAEICGPAEGCDPNSKAPCVFDDPSKGTICPGDKDYPQLSTTAKKCVGRRYCPDFATVYFDIYQLNTFNAPACSNFNALVQETVWRDATNLPRNDLPLQIGPVGLSTAICGITKQQRSLAWPSETCLRGKLSRNKDDGLYYCMNVPDTTKCSNGQIPERQNDGSFICVADT